MDGTKTSKKSHKSKPKNALEDGAAINQDSDVPIEVTSSISTEEVSTEQLECKKKKRSKKNKKSTVDDEAAGEATVDSEESAPPAQQEDTDKKKKKSKKRKAADDAPAVADAPQIETNDTSFPFPSDIVSVLKQQGFTQPTEIQHKSWPIALAGKDLIGLAETGSGKTLAFVLPALMHIRKVRESAQSNGKKKKPSCMVVVLAPTRELAMQTHKVCTQFQHMGVSSVCVYGGMPKQQQFKEIQKGCDIVIATPGRLIDFLEDGSLDLSTCSFAVLDEADRMLDLGFEPQIRRVMSEVPSERHTLMFSATWPTAVEKLANQFLKSPTKVTVGTDQLSGNQMIHQIVEVCEEHEKFFKLTKLLEKWSTKNDKIIIFMLYKKACERMARQLSSKGWHVGELHGDKSQDHRNGVIDDFKKGKVPILVATDVAARGLDVKDVKYVINVEFPLRIEDYVHRIGRTGRAGSTGTSYTFFTKGDKPHSRDLVNVLKESKQAIDPALQAMADTTIAKPKQTAMTKLYGVTSNTLAFDEDVKPKRIVFD